MPVEIRELIIKTEVKGSASSSQTSLSEEELRKWKNSILEECKRMITDGFKKKNIKR